MEEKEGELKKGKNKEKKYSRGEEILKFLIITLISLVIIWFVYVIFLQSESCQDKECFSRDLTLCKKASWLNDGKEATWEYVIKENRDGKCIVEVTFLLAKAGEVSMSKLEGQSMICSLPLGVLTSPEENLEDCEGKLKESFQDLIIKRMHSYILENLGEIGEGLENINSGI